MRECFEWIYLLQLREHVNINANIYKIGRTTQKQFKRFGQYPKGSIILLHRICNDCRIMEKEIFQKFKQLFKHEDQCGKEYFSGSSKEMIKLINSILDYEDIDDVISDEMNDVQESEYIPDGKDVSTTYEDWLEKSDVANVLITNKQNGTGYLRFDNGLFITLHDKNKFGFDGETMEDLSGFIEDTLEKHHHEFDVSKIYKDVINKCYKKEVKYLNLQYDEYVVSVILSENMRHVHTIFNSKNLTFKNVEGFIDEEIITECQKGMRSIYLNDLNNTYDINVNIVDDILSSLISEKHKIEYRKLMHSILVKQYNEPIIFHDWFGGSILIGWLRTVLSTLGPYKYLESTDYFDNKIWFRKVLREHKPKCVIIGQMRAHTIEEQIKLFMNLGFKNIVCINEKQEKCNTVTFRKFLNDNKERVFECIKQFSNYEAKERDIMYDDEIFGTTRLLFTQFLKWCCVW